MEPMGGTELLLNALHQKVSKDLLDQVNVVARPEHFDNEKKQILWVHDLPADMPFLAESAERNKFDGIVFVSSWQQQLFNFNADVPFSSSTVIKNAIDPIDVTEKPNDTIRMVYHPTPHRGLELLVPVFVELAKSHKNIHLDVFSNFDLYARPELNERYEKIYELCKEHDQITYHGTQPNSVVRDALSKAHIFSYPSIWRETSCLCAMEAMSAKCLIVAPNYGALSETIANFGLMYDYDEIPNNHAQKFGLALESAIRAVKESKELDNMLNFQKAYADTFYSWDSRILQWETYLKFIIEMPRKKTGGLSWMPR